MLVYLLKHEEDEGPGTLGAYLESKGVTLVTFDLFRGARLPADADDVCAVISMGGTMNANQVDRYPFLLDECHFLATALHANVPVLGICLGAQLLAKACGARVMKAPVPERGFSPVGITAEGQRDPLFFGVGDYIDVFQWHSDTFDIPARGVRLAEGDACLNQAFRVGRNAYGLQFHVEITAPMIESWFRDSPEKERMLKTLEHMEESLFYSASLIYTNFMSIMLRRLATSRATA